MGQPNGSDTELPGIQALHDVCRIFGIDITDAQLLHHRSNAVYLLPRVNIIARLAPDTELRRERATTSIEVTRWLETQPGGVALLPTPGDQPLIAADAVATFWPYCLTDQTPTLADVATLLRHLHQLPPPPFPVRRYTPLHRLREALTLDVEREQPALSAEDRAWVVERADEVVDTFTTTEFPLGEGLVHGDAHTENVVRQGDHWLLIDWDQCCIGPRELDLISGLPDHFHAGDADRQEFYSAYGYNLLDWPGWTMLRDVAELHSLGAYIRLAPSKPAAATELERRVRSLRTGDREVRWRAVS